MSKNNKYTFFVTGMHCRACEHLIEDELKEHSKVSKIKARLNTNTVEIWGDFGNATQTEIAKELSNKLTKHSISSEKNKRKVDLGEFAIAGPIALGFILLFILLQKFGIVNLIGSNDVTYGTAFIIGIVASLSTCMAVVGGLLLSMSATFAREGDKFKPQMLFHIGRILSFFIFGGTVGMLGSTFQMGVTGTFVLGVIIGLVMLLLGINLLDVFRFTKRLQPSMPKFLSRKALSVTNINHTLTPALVGVITFFLPCGFTQSMQIYTLSTGNFLRGGLTMLAFALGTLPALSLVSFSSLSIRNSSKSGIFFKSAGLIVILFAVYNIINSLVAVGWIPPVFNY